MSSYYDDDQPASHGRARVPGSGPSGPGGGYEPPPDADGFDPFAPQYGAPAYDEPHPPYGPPPQSSGRASVGRAAIRPANYDEPPHDPYGAPVGQDLNDGFDPFAPAYGDPGYGEPAGGPGYGDPAFGDPGGPVGRASVRGSVGAGRATVGRASVGVPEQPGPGGPTGPGGPGGPGGTRPGGRPGGPGGKSSAARKKAKRRNRIIAALASLIMISGVLVVVITYYASSIPTPESLSLPQSTEIDYSNGHKMAQIGSVTREIVALEKVPKPVQEAVIATEDKTFYSNSGVDVKGIVRAFVNNVAGKDTQGASTITQQYARSVANLTYAKSYTRKMREIVIAVKLTQKYSKHDILQDYLNTVPFGRGAYGIQAAAKAYFGVDVGKLTLSQGMVLAGLIKSPESGKFDPSCKCQTATDRWDYTRDQMVSDGYITQAQADQLKYPTDAVSPQSVDDAANQNIATPVGFIVHQVLSELSALKGSDGQLLFARAQTKTSPAVPGDNPPLISGGYKIKTTIDENAEAAAIKAAGGSKGTTMAHVYTTDLKGTKTKVNYAAASLVAVQPGSGRVIAYYGGANGANLDFAGIWADPVEASGVLAGSHVIPGSTFKTITMATALSQEISIHSWWYGPTSRNFKDRGQAITNTPKDDCPGAAHVCQLWQALQHSTNTVYYAVGEKVGLDNIVNMAYDLGINHLWSDSRCQGKRIDLDGSVDSDQLKCIGHELAFGEFGVTVQDVANVMATFANHGTKFNEHFVESVTSGYPTYKPITGASERLVPQKVPGLNQAKVDDETWAMQQVFKNHDEENNQLAGDRQAAVKTGTWQLGDTKETSPFTGNAMFSGFTAGDASNGQIAASVWIGNTGSQLYAVKSNGSDLGGANAPADIWKDFIDAYTKGKPMATFAPAANTGNPDGGETPSPAAPSPTLSTNPLCPNPQLCITPPSGQPSGQPSSEPPAQPQSLTAKVDGVNGHKVLVGVDNTGGGGPLDQGPVNINWGDGASTPNVDSDGKSSHTYGNPGQYTITVTDADNPSRTVSLHVIIT